MVPVDVCINLMCVLAWKAATSPAPDMEPPVYNCTSGGVNPLTWGRVETEGLPILLRNPYEGVFWYPGGSYKENYYVNRFFQVSAKAHSIKYWGWGITKNCTLSVASVMLIISVGSRNPLCESFLGNHKQIIY